MGAGIPTVFSVDTGRQMSYTVCTCKVTPSMVGSGRGGTLPFSVGGGGD